ncbi:MAG: serine/threonine-protein kinase [Planctomycetia bacterium]|nr:serine/threonine-protein kinase [Planctomycetia bacterium]
MASNADSPNEKRAAATTHGDRPVSTKSIVPSKPPAKTVSDAKATAPERPVTTKRPVTKADSVLKKMIGPFLIEKRLGVGGMGIVYKATYTKNGADVALKVLPITLSANRQLVTRFDREMKILKKLKHPHIVQFYGGGEQDGQHFYAMEFIDGGTLGEVLKDKGRLDWQQVVEYGIQLCQALQHAHEHGVVHRDLKPANLFLGKDGKLRLGDFGIARDSDATALTASGATVGTHAYMAPEQITGKQPISNKTDLYALGCVLFEMLTAHPPFQAPAQMELLLKHINEAAPRVRAEVMDCPIFLEQVILQLLEKNPEKRPHDALMVEVALEEVIERVAAQTSSMSQMTSGAGQTSIGLSQITDAAELKKLLGKKRKKKKATGPVWERSWFLMLSLGILICGVVWSLLPMPEEQLFARAQPLMASDDPLKWQEAQDRFLKSLLERFPDGKHAEVARDHRDKLEMHRTERGMETRGKLGQDPKSEAECLYLKAREFERFGDNVTAREQFRAMIDLLKGHEDDRVFRNLAKRQLAGLEVAGPASIDRKQIVDAALKKAREQFLGGKKHLAEETWLNITKLYESNADFADEVAEARSGRAGRLPDATENNISPVLNKQVSERPN